MTEVPSGFQHCLEGSLKKGIHPDYHPVVFRDAGADFAFLCRTTMKVDSARTIAWTDGRTYPVIELEISSASHPFYTGRQKMLDREGRVDRFRKKFGDTTTAQSRRSALSVK